MENNNKKSKPSLIEQAIIVHDWFEATGFEVYPRNNTTVSKEEASIYRNIRRLEEKVVTPLEICYSLEDEDRYYDKMQSKYNLNHRQVQIIVALIKQSRAVKVLHQDRVKKEVEEQVRLRQEEKRKRKIKYSKKTINYKLKDGSGRTITLRFNKQFKIKKPAKALIKAREIRDWMKEINTTHPPRKEGPNLGDVEAKLGRTYSNLRHNLIRKYEIAVQEGNVDEFLETIRKNRKISKSEFAEIYSIFVKIQENNLPKSLVNARKIRDWMNERKTAVPPSPERVDADEEEIKLGRAYYSIRSIIIKPYVDCQTDEEREAILLRLVKTAHLRKEQFFEVKGIFDEIERAKANVGVKSAYLTNIRMRFTGVNVGKATCSATATECDDAYKVLNEFVSEKRSI